MMCLIITSLTFLFGRAYDNRYMKSITRRLLLVLTIIMAYLPMTVVYAMPDISIPEQNVVASEMDMSSCHDEHSSKKCDACNDQFHCHSTASSHFGLALSSEWLGLNQDGLTRYTKHDLNLNFQQPIPLLRPPIFLYN